MKTSTGPLQRWLAGAAALALFSGAAGVLADNSPDTRSFRRVLFLGNSITRHGPNEAIGWSGNWGMAASAQEKDFVHLVTNALSNSAGAAPETMTENIAGFEREYATFDLTPILDKARAFRPDLVILAIGENVPKLKTADAERDFANGLRTLLKGVRAENDPVIVVRGCFWPDKVKDQVLRQVCGEAEGVFVDIGGLSADESNYARSERDFAHEGVAAHPGDKGMKGIADAILDAVRKSGK